MRKLVCVPTLVLLALGWAASCARAAVTSFVAIDVPAHEVLPGHVVLDVQIDFTGYLRGQQMILTLTEGSIFQHPMGGIGPPNSGLFASFPTLEFDTFVTMGGAHSNGPAPPASWGMLVVGGAANLQPGAVQKFDEEGLNIAWAPSTGIDIPDDQGFLTARITLSDDAKGVFSYFGSTSAGTGDPLTRIFPFCFGLTCGGPPTVDDKSVEYTAKSPETLVSEMLDLYSSVSDGTWTLASFDSPNGKPAMVDPHTGVFTWDGFGSPEGIYDAVLKYTDVLGTDTGTLSITWHVPEPASGLLLMVVIFVPGLSRRRN